MKKQIRMWFKTFWVMAGLLFLFFFIGRKTPDIDYEKQARIRQYEEDESIDKLQITPLAYGELLADNMENDRTDTAQERAVLTTDGVYTYTTPEMEAALYRQVRAYCKDGVIIEVEADSEQEETRLANLWISGVDEERIRCFYQGVSFYLPWQTEAENREQVADIVLLDGGVKDCHIKKEKITGKLLGIDEDGISLAGRRLPLAEDVKAYRLYGTFEEILLQELPVGYENTDYVMENGKVCACLVTSEEAMETIRVLLRSGNYEGMYHDDVKLTADCDYQLQCGDKTESFEAGDELAVSKDSGWFKNRDRIVLTASANTGRWKIISLTRNRKTTDYRGSIEILKTEDGLAVINELLLEEYLYGVVPSEMPPSYPAESLKAQAVCARTYAYRNMQKAGLPELGAHVDDSTAFQVYGNTEEHPETTEAVKATKGEILFFEESPVDAYYYSTSCGYGTDTAAWNGAEAARISYLPSKNIGSKGKIKPEELQAEECFSSFIQSKEPGDYECDEAWYRWKYCVDDIDIEEMEERLTQRYAVQPQFVLTLEGEDYTSSQPGRIGTLSELEILSRNNGGNAAQLLITGSEGTYLVQTEYNIRYILANGQNCVTRQDGTEAAVGTLLPSAFFVLEACKEGGTVVGYNLSGGGYGHGIGMSQNGARHMAFSGMKAEEILTFFYEGSKVKSVY